MTDGERDPAQYGGYWSATEYAAPSAPPPSRNRRIGSALVVLLLGATGGVLIGHAAWRAAQARQSAGAARRGSGFGFDGPAGGYGAFGGNSGLPGAVDSNASDGPTDAAAIARDVDPGVVDITTTLANGTAAGTGMVLTPTGEVLTNNHVIAGATSISVRDVGNGNTYRASVVGYDRSHDVALLQLSGASGLSTIRPATSTPSSGAAVVGIGNAGGGGGTPSYAGGAITRTDATVTASNEYDGTSEKLTGLLATDAAIQSGDSGGPLVNSSGEVVGMDTAATAGDRLNGFGITGSGGGGDRGFAIPITDALAIAHQIEAGQASATVHIGPTARLGVYVGQSQTGVAGAQIVHTESGSPAAAAGLTDGDVITAVNATETPSPNALTNVIAQLAPGQRVPVDFVTPGGAARSVTVTLGSGAPQ